MRIFDYNHLVGGRSQCRSHSPADSWGGGGGGGAGKCVGLCELLVGSPSQ